MQYPISHVTDSPKRSRPRHLIPIGLVIALFAFSLTHFLRRSSGTDEAQNRLERVQTWEALYGGEVVRIGKADSAWMGIQKTLGSALANATAISDTSGQSVELIGRSAQGNILVRVLAYPRAIKFDGSGVFRGAGCDLAVIIDTAYQQQVFYFPSGRRRASGQHKGGEKDGLWIFFDEGGSIEELGIYCQGKREGMWVAFGKLPGMVRVVQFKKGVMQRRG